MEALKATPHKELVVGMEEAPTTGTPHLHVYIAFDKQVYMTYVQGIVQAHWEAVRDRKQCIEYCTKDGRVVVEELAYTKKKKALESAIECLQSEGLETVAQEFPYVWALHSRGLRDLQY